MFFWEEGIFHPKRSWDAARLAFDPRAVSWRPSETKKRGAGPSGCRK